MANMSNTPNASALTNAANELRTNARLRFGVYAIVASLWIYGLLVLHDHVKREKTAWQGTEEQIVRIKNAAANVDWTTRAQDVKASLADYERLLWRDGSVSVSQAALQENLARTFAAAGVQVRATQIAAVDANAPQSSDPTLASIADLAPIRIRAQVDFRPQSFYAWLLTLNRDRIEKRPTVIIESLTIRSGATPVADIEFLGYAMRNVSSATSTPSAVPSPAPATAGAPR
jgi:hypothetical protein